jgi:uncharacterized MnhB-related membrane protein
VIVVDTILTTSAVGLAWFVLTSRDLQRSVVLFMAFGVFIALCWARLRAVDVALAEVALGAGLTGALLLRAVSSGRPIVARLSIWRTVAALPAIGFFALLMWVFIGLPSPANDLRADIARELPNSGAENPVTAVLLNFRGWDTLLEVTVLVIALVGTWTLARASHRI